MWEGLRNYCSRLLRLFKSLWASITGTWKESMEFWRSEWKQNFDGLTIWMDANWRLTLKNALITLLLSEPIKFQWKRLIVKQLAAAQIYRKQSMVSKRVVETGGRDSWVESGGWWIYNLNHNFIYLQLVHKKKKKNNTQKIYLDASASCNATYWEWCVGREAVDSSWEHFQTPLGSKPSMSFGPHCPTPILSSRTAPSTNSSPRTNYFHLIASS